MSSISNITQQYAKQQQQQQQKKETQKGGAMFDFLAPSEDEKNKSAGAAPSVPAPSVPAPSPPSENGTPDNNEPTVLDKLKDTFGLGDSTPETEAPAAPTPPPVEPMELFLQQTK